MGGCTVEVRVALEVPHAHQETQLSQPVIAEWYGTSETTGSAISICGPLTNPIRQSLGETYLQINNLSCNNLSGSNLRMYALRVSACGNSPSCRKRKSLPGIDMTASRLARELGCPEPPPDDCNEEADCKMCIRSGGGGANAGGGGGSFGGGGPGETGPGAELRHRAGGVGGDDFPGTPIWRTELGLYWSHDYAERIVEDPDDSKVWLLTQGGSFRKFTDLVGGVYETASPTDEYRTLSRTGSGWELTELDGKVHVFNAIGRWISTTDRFGNAKTGAYNAMGQLESVSFPDGRSEELAYHGDGKLASITEVGIDGTTTRTWDYLWLGDELDRIDRPDGTALEFFYEDASFPGYLTRVEKVGTLGGRRVEAAWEYDVEGNVVALWRGDAVKTGPGAIDLWELSFDNALLPAVTTVTDPLAADSIYTLERDETSRKPKLVSLSGSCPACSAGPNSTFAYNNPAHPLRPTLETDARGHATEMTYDANGQLLTRTEAMGEPEERMTSWAYLPSYPALVTERRQPSTSGGAAERVTTWIYDAAGALTERREEGVEMPGGAYSYSTLYTPAPKAKT